jgi:hypothetical protein
VASPVDQLWHVLLDLGEQLTVPWTLVGGQMVLLHALEHGRVPPPISQDGELVADVRAQPGALSIVVKALSSLSFELEGISADGIGHRYVRPAEPRPVVVDVLAPEGLGDRADLTTTPPGRTLQMPAGTQALSRSEIITVVHEGRSGSVPRPGLLAAIIGKAAATELPGPERHYRDLALLCSLVADPFGLANELSKKDRQRLRKASALLDEAHPAWMLVPADIRAQGQITLSLLLPT